MGFTTFFCVTAFCKFILSTFWCSIWCLVRQYEVDGKRFRESIIKVFVNPAMRNILSRVYASVLLFQRLKNCELFFPATRLYCSAEKNNSQQKNVTVLTMSIHILISKYHILYKKAANLGKKCKKKLASFFWGR